MSQMSEMSDVSAQIFWGELSVRVPQIHLAEGPRGGVTAPHPDTRRVAEPAPKHPREAQLS